MADLSSDILVSAIVVACNSAERIAPCLRILSDEIIRVGGEIIIFDNHSLDSTVKSVSSVTPSAIVIKSEKNIGFAAAVDKASKSAQGKYLLFLNPDVILDHGTIKELMDNMADQLSAGAVVARMRNPDSSFQPTCRHFPTIGNIFFSRGSILSLLGWDQDDKYTLGDFSQAAEVPAASATCMMIERDFFISIGGFDSRFFLFMEDTDLCLRIRQAGRKIYFIPGAGGVHFWGGSSDISPTMRSWCHHVSVWRYFLKHYPNGFSVFLLPIALIVNFVSRAIIGSKRKRQKFHP